MKRKHAAPRHTCPNQLVVTLRRETSLPEKNDEIEAALWAEIDVS